MTLNELNNDITEFVNLAIEELFLVEINKNIKIGSKKLGDPRTKWFSDDKKNIRSNTGMLADSFRSKKNMKNLVNKSETEEVTKFTNNNGKVKGEFGSSLGYAGVHEYGAKIKATERMKKYFWAMYLSTKNIFWKILALHLSKRENNDIEIPKRPYFAKSIDAINDKLPNYIDKYLQTIFANF